MMAAQLAPPTPAEMSEVDTLSLKEWLQGLDCPGMQDALEDQGFGTVESMRQLALDGSGLTDENLQELAEEARVLMGEGAGKLDELSSKVEFDRPEVRARVLRVLEKDTLQRWLSNILKDSSPQRQQETALSLQRGGFMCVADVLESSLTDADLRALGLKQMHTRIKLRKGVEKLVACGERRGIFMLEPDISPVERAKRAVAIEQLLDMQGKLPDDTQLDALADVVSPPDTSVLRVATDTSTASAIAPPSAAGNDLGPTDQQSPTAKSSKFSTLPELPAAAGASTRPHVMPDPTGRPDSVASASQASSLRGDSALSEAKKSLEDQLRELVLAKFSSRVQLNGPSQQPTHKGWTAYNLNKAYMERFGAQDGWWQSCGWRSACEALRGFPDILTAPWANSDVFNHSDVLIPSEHICAERMPKRPSKSRSKSPRGRDRVARHAEDKRRASRRSRSRSRSKRRRRFSRSPERRRRRSRSRSRSPLSSRRSRKHSRSLSRSLDRGRRGTVMTTQQVTTASDDGLVAIGARGYLKFFDDKKGFGFIMSRDHGDIFVHASQKERASHLKVWKEWGRMPDAYMQSKHRENSLENLLEFDVRSSKVPGKLPVAVNLRAAPVSARNGEGRGSGSAMTSPGASNSEDSQVRAYRKQLVQHVVTRHDVERLHAEELLRKVPGELLKRVVEQFDNQIKSRPGSQTPTALLREICRRTRGASGEASPLSAARRSVDRWPERRAHHLGQPNESPVKPPGWREGDPT